MIASRASILFAILCPGFAACGEKTATAPAATTAAAPASQTLEVGCAGCVFHMPGAEGCQLAVKVDGQPYLVSGVEMPGHETGLCDRSRQADLKGKLEGDRFVATSFALKP